MEKLLTVLVQTSPLPSHPSTALAEALFRSFDRVKCLKECNIIILCDGCDDDKELNDTSTSENESTNSMVDEEAAGKTEFATGELVQHNQLNDESAKKERHENKRKNNGSKCNAKKRKPKNKQHNYKHGSVSTEAASNYRLHLKLLKEKIDKKESPFTSSSHGSIRLLQLSHRHGSAKAIAAAFHILDISTPYVLIAQHDNFFVRDVQYLSQLLQYMETEETRSWLKCVHFPSTATLDYVKKIKRRYNLELERVCHYCGGNSLHDVFSKDEKQFQSSQQSQMKPHRLEGMFAPLVFWYGRTHIARTTYYTDKILSDFPLQVGDHLEELWGTHQLREIMESTSTSHNKPSETKTCANIPDELQFNTEYDKKFQKIHAKYGNYVFFETNKSPVYNTSGSNKSYEYLEGQQEVLYHFSGRKAQAAKVETDVEMRPAMMANNHSSKKQNNQPHGISFTTARKALAVVPGLEFSLSTSSISPGLENNEENADLSSLTQLSSLAPIFNGRFRQRCFHCGEKGHSFKFCPEISKGEDSMPQTEVLNLT